jgi:O-antigen/teichoic acid export membrane protein
MQPSKKFAFDVGITFLASVVTMPLGVVITIALGRYLGAGDLWIDGINVIQKIHA